MVQDNFMTWKGSCRVCGRLRSNGAGIFCSNFLLSRGGFRPCMNVWCGGCYRRGVNDHFPIQGPPEEEDGLEVDPVEAGRYRKGRDGDHLMGIPFECDLCHFRNLTHRDPIWGHPRDENMLTNIRGAVLDASWSRATGTVTANLRRIQLDYRAAESMFDIRDPLPHLGNPELRDRVGMGVAITTLHSSLRPGKYSGHLQYDSMRKTPTWFGNVWRSGVAYITDTLYAQDAKRVRATTCPTAGEWFTRFILGAKYRMGQIRKQNEAFTSDIIHAMDKITEELWVVAESEEEKAALEELMLFVLAGFCAGLRGEEVPLISLKGMLEFWQETTNAARPHVMLTLHGRFKGETGVRWHCIPISCRTRTGLPVTKWFRRVLRRRVYLDKRREGWLLADSSGKRRRLKHYEPLLQDVLEKVKIHFPLVIDKVIEIEDFSLWRSMRRGAMTEAANQSIDQHTIDLMGRWRKKEAARGTEPGLPMRQVYTQMKSVYPAMLSFSESF